MIYSASAVYRNVDDAILISLKYYHTSFHGLSIELTFTISEYRLYPLVQAGFHQMYDAIKLRLHRNWVL